ncbi:S41 family peptidase [Larkinella insperata]|uniref:S41 family peptidase n=1 Tax=Larkinella insperata TaxID=332158 RepID=A0ABW3Q9X4_9BACT|nr:S41 family peptidase [Larkinella insperata]
MRVISVWFCFVLVSFTAHAQSPGSLEQTDAYIKIWGLLKYYHPTVCAGSLNWDSVFVAQLPQVTTATSPDQFNQQMTDWIRSLGDLSTRPALPTEYDRQINFNQPHDWFASTPILSTATVALLKDVVRYRHTGPKQYVKIQSPGIAVVQNEQPYADIAYPTESYRLLALARYWNIIAYFFPYRYLTDQPWNEVLTTLIPPIRDAKNATAYLQTLRVLAAKVNDSHSRMIGNPHRVKVLEEANFYLPIQATVIDRKLVITGFRHPATAESLGLQPGDAILTIDQDSIPSRIARYAPLLGASNQAVVHRDVAEYLIWQATDSAVVTFQRGNQLLNRTVRLATLGEFRDEGNPVSSKPAYSILAENVGYINIGQLEASQVKKIFRKLKKTQGLIIDLRTYPKSFLSYPKLCNCLSTASTRFVKYLYPNLSYPGTFRASVNYCGQQRDRPPYAGKIAILVNEYTQSMGEFFAMAFRTLPRSTIIGSQTAGADGDITTIPLPGGYRVLMTGSGIYYPDMRPTQRIGIVADRAVAPTIEGIRQGRDEILERAMHYLKEP